MLVLLVEGDEDIISAASVTYCWVADVGIGLDVDKVGVAFNLFLPRAVFGGYKIGSCFYVVEVEVLVDGFDSIINRHRWS